MANIQEKIDSINEELEKLRLPHKLKQYRYYAECLEQLKIMISSSTTTTESQKSMMIEQIDQLFTKLDKTVICGVDQCFVCGTNNQRINSSKFSSKHQQNDKQKQSNQQQTNDHNNNEIHQNHQQNGHKHDHHSNDDDDNDQSNQSDRLLQTMREKLRNTSSSPILKIVETKTMIENEMKKHTEQESNEIVNNKDDNVVNDDDKAVKNVKQCDDTDNNETVINSKHDEQIDNNDHNDDGQKSIINDAKQNYHNDNDKTKPIANVIDNKDLSPSNEQNGKQNSNILSSLSSTILMTPRPFHKQPLSSSNIVTGSCGNSIIQNNNDNHHHHSIISGRSIISSYKAYKDFINNYTTATASTTAAANLINDHR